MSITNSDVNMSDTVIKDMHKRLKGQITRKYNESVCKCAFILRTKQRNIGQNIDLPQKKTIF